MHNLVEVDAWVEKLSHIPYERFYASAIARRVNLPLEAVVRRLFDLANAGKLEVIFEVRCPECDRRLKDYLDRKDIPNTYYCMDCDIQFLVDEDIINLAFRFSNVSRDSKRS